MKTLTLSLFFLHFLLIPNELTTDFTKSAIQNNEPETFNHYTVNHEDYSLYFSIETTKQDQQVLVIDVELHNNSYFVSPNAKGDYTGKFRRDFGDTQNIDFDGQLIEIPLSVETDNLFGPGKVNLIKENTTYKQPLLLKTKNDFQVFGRFIFTIEPRCTLETVPFSIVQKNGKLAFTDPKC